MIIKPTEKQLSFLDWEFGAFFHFGIRSFFPGHSNWDGLPMPASAFNPDRLDCEQWIRTAKSAGATYAIFTVKHHDGFANWPSKYSDYTVAQSPWKDGKGDVVKEFTTACRKYGLHVGLYYSPAQWGDSAKFDDPKEYDDYFVNQITELLTNYGKIDYIWFDGCGSENHEYDKDRIIHVIRSLQPEISIYSMWDPETRWVGNEDGYADMPNINVVERPERLLSNESIALGRTKYLPAECDMMMRDDSWFHDREDADTVKTVDELIGIYECSVGRGANLLLNIGPDQHGLLPEEDTERLLEFGKEIRRRYGHPLPFTDVRKEDNEFRITTKAGFGSWNSELVDSIVIEEDITEGERINSFRIYAALPRYADKRICVFKGDTVGHKRICRIPPVKTSQLSLVIETAEGEVSVRSMKAYYTAES